MSAEQSTTMSTHEKVFHFTVAERAARGKAARAEVPRSSHGEWTPSPTRPDPVALLEQQGETRVPELVPIRYGRMLVSPFTFYRGAAYIMASDLAGSPRTGLHTQLCGDAHLSNFGAFAAPDRRLIFGVNDFDETLPGPFEWDLKRLVASFAVGGRDRGFSAKERRGINIAVTESYRTTMRDLATKRTLDLWYSRVDVDEILELGRNSATPKQLATAEKNVAKARTKDSVRAFDKLTEVVDGKRRIIADAPLIVPIEDLMGDAGAEQIEAFARGVIRSYRSSLSLDRSHLMERFNYAHAARKVVGVGSVGTRAWIVLMLGHDENDPLFLQIKQAEPSVLEPFLGRSEYPTHGQRVVEGQRLMQAASDIMLGWDKITGPDGVERHFYIRQLWDQKGSALVDVMAVNVMEFYARICGETLARAHARSGDAVAIASYMGSGSALDRALADFSELYSDQNDADYAALQAAVQSGRIAVETGL
jgi:uncharacterized protein (DUF2252 family)